MLSVSGPLHVEEGEDEDSVELYALGKGSREAAGPAFSALSR